MKQATRTVRHKSRVGLLLVDVINHFEFPDGKNILRRSRAIAPPMGRLKKRARTAREHRQALEHVGAMADAKVVTSASGLRLETLHG